jgi:dolichol-phosphate mannosyltransferase
MSDAAKSKERVLVAIASYNERQTLPSLLDEIFLRVPRADVLVIDDASPDGTGVYCDERAAADARLKVIHRAGKLGLGTAILASFEYAIERKYDYLVGLDADWSHPPEKITALLDRANGADGEGGFEVVLGSRYIAGGGVKGWPLHRRIASKMVNQFARLLLGLPVRDCSGGFRCFRVDALAPVVREGLKSRSYAIFEEVLLRLNEQGALMSEIPFTFVDRTQGKSKLTLPETIRAISALFGLAFGRLTRSRRRSSEDRR